MSTHSILPAQKDSGTLNIGHTGRGRKMGVKGQQINRGTIPSGKVLSCSDEFAIRYRFVQRPIDTILEDIFNWIEQRKEAVLNFQWVEDGWIIKIYIRQHRTDWMAEVAIDLTNYLKRNGFPA